MKPLHQQSVETLLDSLKHSSKEEINSLFITHDVLSFIGHFKIESGSNPIRINLLFNLYSSWSTDPLSGSAFRKTIKEHFPNKHSSVLINLKVLDVTKNTIKLLEQSEKKLGNNKWTKFHFESFLKYHSIDRGHTPTDIDVLYYLYDIWTYYKKGPKFNKDHFKSLCKVYLKHTNINNSMCFYVSSNIKTTLSMEKQLQILAGKSFREKTKSKKKENRPKRTQ